MASGWRNPEYDLMLRSKTVFEQALALSLALCSLVFMTYRNFEVQAYGGSGETDIIEITRIPETDQIRRPPPPQRPQIPIATESEDVPEDVTIMDTEMDLTVPPPPPPRRPGGIGAEEPMVFTVWEEPPVVTRKVFPVYPEMARKAMVEGKVTLLIIVDEKGNVIEAEVVAASPPGIFEEAAVSAILQWKFKPAKQRGQAIRVRMGQTIEFKLKDIPPDL